jgi:hypothetical protein
MVTARTGSNLRPPLSAPAPKTKDEDEDEDGIDAAALAPVSKKKA